MLIKDLLTWQPASKRIMHDQRLGVVRGIGAGQGGSSGVPLVPGRSARWEREPDNGEVA